jgi:hypothetical protein
MLEAYLSGDPYLAFAKQARALPADAIKKGNEHVRNLFKQCALGVQYGISARALSARLDQPEIVTRGLLRLHYETYRTMWKWSDAIVDFAFLNNRLRTNYGWAVHITSKTNPRSVMNFPMQAHGAEMLRIACCLGIERGVEICAPVHDAVLICAPIARLESDIATMRQAMAEASRLVLCGFELRTAVEPEPIHYPHRYMDDRGRTMWARVMKLVADLQQKEADHGKEDAA